MSFAGDLEHLSIVDIIQLLHTTRKSGTLSVRGRKGESQLVFDEGYIVSANHVDNSVRIGNILVEAQVISREILDQALQDQQNAGSNRKPLVATLIEQGKVRKEDAYRGLETLIELTVVEILTWKRGTFSLDVERVTVSDEYRYFPEKLNEEIILHTENVLMDALRIYDEKKRDGLLVEESADEEFLSDMAAAPVESGWLLSADDLGLGELDHLEKKLPSTFTGLEERGPAAEQCRKIRELAPALPGPEQEELARFLVRPAVRSRCEDGSAPTVILFGSDPLLTHCLTTVCKTEGIWVFSTNEEQYLDHFIGQSRAKGSSPLLVFDAPGQSGEGGAAAAIGALRHQKGDECPQLALVQLVSTRDYGFTLQALREGVGTVIPRPARDERPETFLNDLLLFLETFPELVRAPRLQAASGAVARLRPSFVALQRLTEPPELALVLLQAVAAACDRAVTLIVRGTELIAEKAIGVTPGSQRAATGPLGFRIPLAEAPLLREVVNSGAPFFGTAADLALGSQLSATIGAPLRPAVLLLPLQSCGKIISLTYGDFGQREVAPVELELLEILAGLAGLVLENAFYRRKRERPAA